jgi:mRNA interferase MazF
VVIVESDAALEALPGSAVCMMIDKRLRAGELLGPIDAPTIERISATLRVALELS